MSDNADLVEAAKTVALQFYHAGCGINYALQQASEYTREILRMRGDRNPVSRIALTATLAPQIAQAAGLHPDQISHYHQEMMDAYRKAPNVTVFPNQEDQKL